MRFFFVGTTKAITKHSCPLLLWFILLCFCFVDRTNVGRQIRLEACRDMEGGGGMRCEAPKIISHPKKSANLGRSACNQSIWHGGNSTALFVGVTDRPCGEGWGGMGWGMGGDQKHTATFRRATLTLPAPLPLPRAPQRTPLNPAGWSP